MTRWHLPRHAELWLPGLIADRARRVGRQRSRDQVVWLTVADHYEPQWGGATLEVARERVATWVRRWPEVAARHVDSFGRPPRYTFFYPQEEYHPSLLDPLAGLAESGVADVEVHIHHDGDTPAEFVEKLSRFIEELSTTHGLLHDEYGRTAFGFIHGNWALDNARPDRRWCGLDNELTLLRELGCYADFTLPAAPDPCQTRRVNSIYWAVDDPHAPKSHDTGRPAVPGNPGPPDALLMVQGPLGVVWPPDRWPRPALEVGELAGHHPVTRTRVRCWLDHAPTIGKHRFVKLHGHGAPEKNATPLLDGDLDRMLTLVATECAARGWQLAFASAWELYRAARSLIGGGDPTPTSGTRPTTTGERATP